MPFEADAMPDENLTIERDGAVAVLTVARPAVLNALNDRTITELEGAVSRLTAEDDGARGDSDRRRGQGVHRRSRHSRAGGAESGRRRDAGGPRTGVVPRAGADGQAGDRGRQRLCAGRRLRAGHGLHAAHRGRHGEARPAGGRARLVARLWRHAAAAAAGRRRTSTGDDPDRRSRSTRRRPAGSAWSTGSCRGPS